MTPTNLNECIANVTRGQNMILQSQQLLRENGLWMLQVTQTMLTARLQYPTNTVSAVPAYHIINQQMLDTMQEMRYVIVHMDTIIERLHNLA